MNGKSLGYTQSFSKKLTISSAELKRINYKTQHNSEISISKTLQKVISYAYEEGFLTAYFDTTANTSKELSLNLNTGTKYKIAKINIDDSLLNILKPNIREKHLTNRILSPKNVAEIHQSIGSYYENNGYPFVTSQFKNIEISENNFTADLKIKKGLFIKYDSLIIKGEAKISHQFISNYLNIKNGSPYNESDISQITSKISGLQFLKEIRPHEIVFKPGKAIVYIYLDKGRGSNANGILGLQPDNQTGKINITGEIQLKLQNAFKIAETLQLEWRKLQPKTQNLDVLIRFPMLFKTPLGVEGTFNLYKRDTSFLDLAGKAGLIYTLNGFNTIGVFYKIVNSQPLSNSANLNIIDITPVKKNHFGISANFQKFDNFLNPTRGYSINSSVSFVNRNVTEFDTDTSNNTLTTNAYEGTLKSQFFIPLGFRHTIRVGAQAYVQWAPNIYKNELYRIGGLNTLRGFDEESINISTAAIASFEYRFLLDAFSNIFAFFDIAGYEAKSVNGYKQDYPFGFGAGINFATKFGTFSLTYAFGKQEDNPINVRSGKIHFGYINNF